MLLHIGGNVLRARVDGGRLSVDVWRMQKGVLTLCWSESVQTAGAGARAAHD